MRWFKRRNEGLFKKGESRVPALAGNFVRYNWMRIRKAIRTMAAGLTRTLRNWEDIIAMMDPANEAKKRGP